MKTRFLIHLTCIAILGISLVLAAAGPRPAQAAAPTINLTIWAFSDGLSPTETGVLSAYSSSHPGVTFTVYQPADFMAELAVAIPAGTGPDILYFVNDALPMLVLNHYLTRLEPYGITTAYLAANFEPVTVNAALFSGAVWAIPHVQEGIALVYNKNVVPGQYLPADPQNFADLALKAAQYHAAYPTKTLICNQGFTTSDAYHVAPIFFGHGIPEYITENGTAYINDPRAVTAAEWIQNIHSVLGDVQDYTTCQNQLIAGNVGMWWTGPWAITALNNAGVNYGILPMGKPYVGVKEQMVTVNAVSRGYADEAIDFLTFFNNPANSILYATQESQIPANTVALNSPTVQALPVIKGFSQSIALGTPLGKSLYTQCQWAPVGSVIVTLWNNAAASAQDELDAAQTTVQACINWLRDTYFPERLLLPFVRR